MSLGAVSRDMIAHSNLGNYTKPMEKQKDVAGWMDENNLTSHKFAVAVRYSPGAVSKWRQKITLPSERAEREIIKVQKRKGWTPFPSRYF